MRFKAPAAVVLAGQDEVLDGVGVGGALEVDDLGECAPDVKPDRTEGREGKGDDRDEMREDAFIVDVLLPHPTRSKIAALLSRGGVPG